MSTNYDRKLPMRVKLGYPIASIGSTLQMLIQMYFLLMFYTNFLGLSGYAAGLIVMIARIWDFINDPIMGSIVEKVKRPEKCLFIMRCALVPIAIFMVLVFMAPDMSYNMKIVWAFVTFICFGMSQTAFSIAKDTLNPRLTTDKVERAKLNVYANVINTILNAIVPAVTMPLVGWLAGFGASTAFAKVAAIYAVVYIITGLIGTQMCKGYDNSDDDMEMSQKSSVKFSEMIKALAQNTAALSVLAIQVVKMLFSSIGGSILLYFCTYNLGDPNAMSLASSLSTFTGMLPVFFLVPLYKKFGNAGTGMIGCVIAIATYVAMLISGVPSVTFFVGAYMVGSIGTTLCSSVLNQNIMDALDYGEWKTGHKNTGVIMSAYGMGTKIGLAFGSTIAGFVIGALHFNPEAVTQPANVLSAFFHITVTAQLAVFVVRFLLMFYLNKIEKKLPQMRKEVEERKAKVSA